jgi:hypothetical protein
MRQITFLLIGLLLQGWTLEIALSAIYTRRLCTGEPALQPLSFHSCPNESVTFTCSDSKVSLMKWEVEPHTMADLAYAASLLMADTELLTMNSTDNILHSTRLNHGVHYSVTAFRYASGIRKSPIGEVKHLTRRSRERVCALRPGARIHLAFYCSMQLQSSAMIHLLFLYSGLLSTVWGQPTLYPPSIHACPNETVTYYCHGSQIRVILWEVQPYITLANPMQYVAELATLPAGRLPMDSDDKFFANLTNINITRLDGKVADMTTSLMIITYGIRNNTNITCRVQKGDFEALHSSSTLYFIGLLFENFVYDF